MVVPAIVACSSATTVQPATQPVAPVTTFDAKATSGQYLYVYNTGSPGIYSGQYARYSLPKLKLLEMTVADGLGSNEVFGKKNLPYFIDEATPSGFGVYLQPIALNTVPGKQQFYGIPCYANALAIGPTGNFYAAQYCSTNVLEYKPGVLTGKPKKPIATYTGGNLGKNGVTNPTYAVVDPSGDLYVGDNGGGVTYFPAGSTTGSVAFATGNGGYVNQMIVDSSGDVWSIHGPNPTAVYFQDKTHCILDPSGTVVRNELAERFNKGTLVQQLYTATTDSPLFSDNGISIAIDSAGRIYTGNQNNGIPGVVLDFDPGQSCPNDNLSFAMNNGANPQVAVDNQKRYYVTNYENNTIASYNGGSTKRIAQISQQTGIVNIKSTAINP
ncbi:MAG: hypothetical protein JOY69_11225 [Candidatus Eremiobacteraeota bacterium]|nr:hypothetical protein [Candidatus Eremiobacteraeota bacterium]